MLELLLAVGVILVLVGVVYMLERRVKTKGALFTGQSTPMTRLAALVLGLFFGGLFLWELLFSDIVHFLPPLLAVALIGYGLGSGRLLGRLQGGKGADS